LPKTDTTLGSLPILDEHREAYVRFVECCQDGTALQDIYAEAEHGYAQRRRDTRDPQGHRKGLEEGRKQFLKIYEHTRNIVDPVDQYVGLTGKRVLDFGCGTGALAVALALKGAVVTGVDPAPSSLEACQWRARYFGVDESRFSTRLVKVAPGLPFPDESFDVITSNSVMEFIPRDRHLYLLDLLRLLRVGGCLVISTENGLYPLDYYTRCLLPLWRRKTMIEKNLPYGVTYFELLRWIRGSPRSVENLGVRNWFNSMDKRAAGLAATGRPVLARGVESANRLFKSACRLLGIPSDVFLPYTTFIFRVQR
jgi:2-polyprenyl-3-methyl-5-hydroxy-6-metoxy-1,4-benzoquinol methylase